MEGLQDRSEVEVLPGRPAHGQLPARPPRLRRRVRGYRRDAVEQLLDALAARCVQADHERAELRSRVERLDGELARLLELERSVRDTIVAAHVEADALHEDALRAAGAIAETQGAHRRQTAGELERERSLLEHELGRIEVLEKETRSAIASLVADALEEGERLPPAAHPGLDPDEPASRAEPEETGGLTWLEEPAELELAREAAPTLAADDDDPTEGFLFEPLDVPEPAPLGTGLVERPVAGSKEPTGRAGGPWPSPLVLATSLVVAGALVFAAFVQFGPGGGPAGTDGAPARPAPTAVPADPGAAAPASATQPAAAPVAVAAAETTAAPATAKLVLAATTGDSWVQVRAGSARGRVLYEGFIGKGTSRQFSGRRLWVRMGSPSTLSARLDGKPVRNLPAGVANVLVTPHGVRTLGLG